MRVNVNHPSFISFLETVTSNILSNVSVETYFSLPNDKKLRLQYTVLKVMKNSVKVRAKLSDNELKSFVNVILKKNEEYENYEFAAILKDIYTNFDNVNETTTPKPKLKRIIKTDKTNNAQ